LRLAVVSQPTDLVPGGGSVAIWTRELGQRLVPRHEITVFSGSHEGEAQRECVDGIEHVRIATNRDETAIRLLRALGRRVGREEALFYRYYFGWAYYRDYIRQIGREIARSAFDAILVMNFAQFVPVLRRHDPSARIALMMHCDWLVELEREKTRRWLADADAICGCSRHVAEGVATRFPELAPRCHPILNVSNPERFAKNPGMRERATALRMKLGLEDRTVILFVGRVCPEKGVHVLLEAMQRVQEECEDVVLLVLGGLSQQPPSPLWVRNRDERFAEFEVLKRDYQSELDRRAAGLGDRVRFLGKLPYEDLPEYYGLADIFVHPAVWQEPFGMILTEAMGCGLPVVSTRAGGIPEIVIDGRTGLLATPGDPESLAEALVELVQAPARRREMGRLGRERLDEHLTWEHTADAMQAVLCPPPEPPRGRATGEASSPYAKDREGSTGAND